MVCGVLAAVIGPLQFWPKMRRDYLPFHPIAGRIYVVAVLVGAIASVGMAAKVGSDDAAYAFGLIGLSLAWVTTTVMAFVAIRRKNLPSTNNGWSAARWSLSLSLLFGWLKI